MPVADKSFQSTRPTRGATPRHLLWRPSESFNPRAPRGARLAGVWTSPSRVVFQSTRPTRGATSAPGRLQVLSAVSIHAPHAGRDGASMDRALGDRVSIHAPHAGRDHLAS